MKYSLIIACMVLRMSSLSGQVPDCRCDYDEAEGILPEEKLTCIVKPSVVNRLPDNEIYGQWRYGNIILNNGEVLNGKFLRYDGLNDQLILNSNDPAYMLEVEKYTIQGFDIETFIPGRILQFRRVNVMDKQTSVSQDVFLQVLVSGKNTLYVHRKLMKTLEVNKIARYYTYFVLRDDGTMVKLVRLTQRSFLRLFPAEQDVYRSYLRKQHIHVRNEEQVVMAVALINSL